MSSTLQELEATWNECRESNWDGYQALPVPQDAYRQARRFVEALPPGFPAPTFGAEPDGAITMEWYRAAQWQLSVSVTGAGGLSYAALFGVNSVCGQESLCDGVPAIILRLIQQVGLPESA